MPICSLLKKCCFLFRIVGEGCDSTLTPEKKKKGLGRALLQRNWGRTLFPNVTHAWWTPLLHAQAVHSEPIWRNRLPAWKPFKDIRSILFYFENTFIVLLQEKKSNEDSWYSLSNLLLLAWDNTQDLIPLNDLFFSPGLLIRQISQHTHVYGASVCKQLCTVHLKYNDDT